MVFLTERVCDMVNLMKKAGLFAALFCLAVTIPQFWIAEDSYITLRVVENLYSGIGPVFNAGERTEVYTHPTWFMLLVAFRGAGISPPVAVAILSLLFLVLSIWLLVKEHSKAAVIPVLFLAAFPGFRDFVLSGMEYPLVLFLMVCFYLELDKKRLSDRPVYFFSILALLYLTRPELGLMGAFYGLFLFLELVFVDRHRPDRQKIAILFKAAFTLLLIAGSWHLLRYAYYGELFPNTYYAKAGLSVYYLQGLKYVTHAVLFGPAILLFIVISGIYLWKSYRMATGLFDPHFFAVIREILLITLLTFYVIRLGGDFMAFRFILPVFTILALFSRRYLVRIFDEQWLDPSSEKAVIRVAFITAFLFLWIPVPKSKGYIADERAHFTEKFEPGSSTVTRYAAYLDPAKHPWGKAGTTVRNLQECLDYSPFIIANSQAEAQCREGMGLGYSGYAAGPKVSIIDEQGISDPYVARLPVPLRFRPGHEHSIGTYEVFEKQVLFCRSGDLRYDEIMQTPYGVMIRLDPDLLATLPDARLRLQKLMQIKRQGSPGLEMAEFYSKITVEELYARSAGWAADPVMTERYRCWSGQPGQENL